MSGLIRRQAMMVSFVGIVRLLALMFLLLVPLVFLMKRPVSCNSIIITTLTQAG
jgi:hypothetical protein